MKNHLDKAPLFIFANNPVNYHEFIYRRLTDTFNVKVFYKNIKTAEYFYDASIGGMVDPGNNLLNGGYLYVDFSKRNFFSNLLMILMEFFKNKNCRILIQGYDGLYMHLGYILGIIFRKKIFFKGEVFFKSRGYLLLIALKTYFMFYHRVLYTTQSAFDFYKSINKAAACTYFPSSIDESEFIERYEALESRDDLRRQFGFKNSSFIVIVVGRIDERKQPLRVLAEYGLSSIEDKRIIFVGDGPQANLVRNTKLSGVVVTGWLSPNDVIKYLKVADLFVLGSSEDYSPKALSEALAVGLPCAVSKHVGNLVDVSECYTGVEGFDPIQYGDLARIIENRCNSPLRARLKLPSQPSEVAIENLCKVLL